MGDYIACDMHKKYSVFGALSDGWNDGRMIRIAHDRKTMRTFLRRLPEHSTVAVETTGNWYWLIDEIEHAGHTPQLVHARKAKLLMGNLDKTDKLDVRALATQQRNNILPTVWIPPAEIRDQRELVRLRMALSGVRTMLKNRIHAALDKYAIRVEEVTDLFGVSGRKLLEARLGELPEETRRCVQDQLTLLDQVLERIEETETRIRALVAETTEMKLVKTLPGVGDILGILIALEVGTVGRFASAERLASYAGTVPRVSSSGGKTRYGHIRPDVNRYLRWAFVEAANAIVLHQKRWPETHVVQLYLRLKQRKGTGIAIVAVARHLAEATYWVLTKREEYREPKKNTAVSSTHG